MKTGPGYMHGERIDRRSRLKTLVLNSRARYLHDYYEYLRVQNELL